MWVRTWLWGFLFIWMLKEAPRHSVRGKRLFWYGFMAPSPSSYSFVPMVPLMAQVGQNTMAKILLLDSSLVSFWQRLLSLVLSVRLKWEIPPHQHFYLPAGRTASCHRSAGFRTLLMSFGFWRGTWTTTKTGSCLESINTCLSSPKMQLRKVQMWKSVGERKREEHPWNKRKKPG